MKNEVLIGPNLEQTMITAGLDFYKPTMSQLAYDKQPETEVTFTFKNRGSQNLLEYVEPEVIGSRLEQIRQNSFSDDEISFLGDIRNSANEPMFSENFLQSLSENELPKVSIEIKDNDLAFSTTGEWSMVTFWETVLMSEVNEIYFENYIKANGIDVMKLYDEGEKRLNEKINIFRDNPDIKFSDFGTRRHFSLRWQKYVVERLKDECPDNFLGTSNVALSKLLGTKPVGTFAHEMPMVYAGMADAKGKDIRKSHGKFLNDWYEQYGNDLSIALTDTFGTEFFFSDFTEEQADKWRALRQDSGDPIEFGEKAIEFYENNNVNPKQKTIVFSDGLDIDQIVKLHDYFKGKINVVFGWGTTLTNDLGVKTLNIVMKATHVKLDDGREADLVKLSDNEGKHTGPLGKIALYQEVFN